MGFGVGIVGVGLHLHSLLATPGAFCCPCAHSACVQIALLVGPQHASLMPPIHPLQILV